MQRTVAGGCGTAIFVLHNDRHAAIAVAAARADGNAVIGGGIVHENQLPDVTVCFISEWMAPQMNRTPLKFAMMTETSGAVLMPVPSSRVWHGESELPPEADRPAEMDNHRGNAGGERAAPSLLKPEHESGQETAEDHRNAGAMASGIHGNSMSARIVGKTHAGRHWPNLRPHPVMHQRARSPSAIVHVLAIEGQRMRSRKVGDVDHAREPDLAASARKTDIEFRILVMTQALVVAADGENCSRSNSA